MILKEIYVKIIWLKECVRVYIINDAQRTHKKGEQVMIYDLQKAGMWKRMSAFLFDFIIFLVVVVGLAFIVSSIVGYDAKVETLEGYYREYEATYGITVDISEEDYAKLTDAEKANYENAQKVFEKDERVIGITNELFNLTLVISSLSILFSFVIMEFVIPLFLRNGQTLGKRIFGICLMRDDGVKITPVMLFVRSILGKCTIETMVPLLILFLIFMGGAGILGWFALLGLLVLQIALMIKTRTNSMIHDLLAYTVAVDKESQMIFETKEAMIEYKNKIHAEEAEKKLY